MQSHPPTDLHEWHGMTNDYVVACLSSFTRSVSSGQQIGPMNIGNPTEFTIKELAEMTVRLTKSTSKIIYKPLPQVPPLTVSSMTNVFVRLFSPATSIKQ